MINATAANKAYAQFVYAHPNASSLTVGTVSGGQCVSVLFASSGSRSVMMFLQQALVEK